MARQYNFRSLTTVVYFNIRVTLSNQRDEIAPKVAIWTMYSMRKQALRLGLKGALEALGISELPDGGRIRRGEIRTARSGTIFGEGTNEVSRFEGGAGNS